MVRKILNVLIIAVLAIGQFYPVAVLGQVNPDELKNKIEDRNAQIKKLEEEIKQYNVEVENTQKEAKTLQNTLKTLDTTKKKITADINLTQTKISKTVLTIDQLGTDITKTQSNI